MKNHRFLLMALVFCSAVCFTALAQDMTDKDLDGLPDVWEEHFGLDSSRADGIDGAYGDPTASGFNNYAVYLAGQYSIGTNDYNAGKTNTIVGLTPTNMYSLGLGIPDMYARPEGNNLTLRQLYTDGDYIDPLWKLTNGLYGTVGQNDNAVETEGTATVWDRWVMSCFGVENTATFEFDVHLPKVEYLGDYASSHVVFEMYRNGYYGGRSEVWTIPVSNFVGSSYTFTKTFDNFNTFSNVNFMAYLKIPGSSGEGSSGGGSSGEGWTDKDPMALQSPFFYKVDPHLTKLSFYLIPNVPLTTGAYINKIYRREWLFTRFNRFYFPDVMFTDIAGTEPFLIYIKRNTLDNAPSTTIMYSCFLNDIGGVHEGALLETIGYMDNKYVLLDYSMSSGSVINLTLYSNATYAVEYISSNGTNLTISSEALFQTFDKDKNITLTTLQSEPIIIADEAFPNMATTTVAPPTRLLHVKQIISTTTNEYYAFCDLSYPNRRDFMPEIVFRPNFPLQYGTNSFGIAYTSFVANKDTGKHITAPSYTNINVIYQKPDREPPGFNEQKVIVKYTGVSTNTMLRVAAYNGPLMEDPYPVSFAYVTADESLTNLLVGTEATLINLKPGKYFVKAWLDSDNDDAKCDKKNEPWGYYRELGNRKVSPFKPKQIEIYKNKASSGPIEIYIEDQIY